VRSRRRITAALVGLVALALVGWLVREHVVDGGPAPSAPVSAVSTVPGADSGIPVRPLSALPPEAAATLRLIEQGGPFPFPSADGDVFANREKRLPTKESGYYREYTVRTPGSADRGQRRLVTGAADELYYTDDHYLSFVLVDPGG
jgi:ribonuclease T1